MDEYEKFLFDLNGYLVVENVLSAEELEACNDAIDSHPEGMVSKESLSHGSKALAGTQLRGDLEGMLTWPKPWCQPFRDLLAHPTILPYLTELLREGFRLDHVYGIVMRRGAEGLVLHHDGTKDDLTSFYQFHNGRMRSGLTVVSWMLTGAGPGAGGLMCIPGSHKSNYTVPEDVAHLERDIGVVQQVEAKAGSAVIFTEALGHGTLPWKAEHDRRSILYKYSPAPLSWDKRYVPEGVEEVMDELTPDQQALLVPPYNKFLKRPTLSG